MQPSEKTDHRGKNRESLEDAFREAEANLRLEGLDPDSPVYRNVKERVLRGELGFDEAVSIIMSQKPDVE